MRRNFCYTLYDDVINNANDVISSYHDVSLNRNDNSRNDVITSRGDVIICRKDVITSRDDVTTSFNDVITSCNDVITTFNDVITSRDDVVTNRDDVITTFNDVITSGGDVITRQCNRVCRYTASLGRRKRPHPGPNIGSMFDKLGEWLRMMWIIGFQLVSTHVPYRGSHPQPMSPCLGSRHISHFSLLSSGQFDRKYISGRNSTNRQT